MTHSTTTTVAVAQHRIPQTFELRPSGPIAAAADRLLDYPDELMIDWGNTPAGSTAMIYWPQAKGIDVVRLARRLYGTDEWSLLDPNTLMCTVNGGVSFLPIPGGGTERIAGLFTVDLPSGVKVGEEFNIVVRRFSTRRPPPTRPVANRGQKSPRGTVQTNWRYTVGTFQVKIPVAHPKSTSSLLRTEHLLDHEMAARPARADRPLVPGAAALRRLPGRPGNRFRRGSLGNRPLADRRGPSTPKARRGGNC